MELEVRRVCTIDGSPHPLPVICTCSASTSDYTCRPNIHYLLYMYSFLQLLCQLHKEEQSSLHLPPSHPQPPQLVHLVSVEHSYSHNVCCYTTVMCVIVRIVYMSISRGNPLTDACWKCVRRQIISTLLLVQQQLSMPVSLLDNRNYVR